MAAPTLLRTVGREAIAFARLAVLLPRDLGDVVPADPPRGAPLVVVVHGLMATAGALRPLRRHLERAAGAWTASFTYPPSAGVEAIAEALGALCSKLPEDARIHLVGHSVGGLAARFYVQAPPGDARIVQTLSLAAPFEGARGASLYPGGAGRDIRRDSAVLRYLAETAGAEHAPPHAALLAGADTAVPATTRFPVGARLVLPGRAHNTLLFDPEAHAWVAERVLHPPVPRAPRTW